MIDINFGVFSFLCEIVEGFTVIFKDGRNLQVLLIFQEPVEVVGGFIHLLRCIGVGLFTLVLFGLFREKQGLVECSLIIDVAVILLFRIILEHFLHFFSSSFLILLKSQLLRSSQLQISLLPSSHIGSIPAISLRQALLKLLRQNIHLHGIQSHMVHKLTISWFLRCLENLPFLASLHILCLNRLCILAA